MKEKIKKRKAGSILTGVAGEYFVAAELSKMGYIASITLRNTRGIDILVSNKAASKTVGIQVKATTYYNTKSWMLNQKAEDYYADNLFYVFVNIKEGKERPDFFIVPSEIVAKQVRPNHKKWLKGISRSGEKHKDTSIRKFKDPNKYYLERWDLLDL